MSDISILYTAQQLEPHLKMKKNHQLQVVDDPHETTEEERADDYLTALLREYNNDCDRVYNAEVRAGFDTSAKRVLHLYLTQLGTMGIATNLTTLCLEENERRRHFRDEREWKEMEPKMYHIPTAYERVISIDSYGYQRCESIIIARPDLEKIMQKQYGEVYWSFSEGSMRENLKHSGILNFKDFFSEIMPAWLDKEVAERLDKKVVFNLLNVITVRPQENGEVMLTHEYRPTYHAHTVLESY
ncbi:hypothetical protein HY639_01680 [Candidatus Woesearchaeota archaeon]|nr:hypothetical protein [Candidatus Woesearchaeota archaeon]